MLCSLLLTPISWPGTMSLSMPHMPRQDAAVLAGRQKAGHHTLPTHPAQPPGDGAVQGKGRIFCAEAFCWGTGSAVPACWVLAQCMAKALPSSLLEQAAEADTYTGQNLFPNTSFISFSHEIFLLEYSLHLENRREFFYKAHHIIDYIETSPPHLCS